MSLFLKGRRVKMQTNTIRFLPILGFILLFSGCSKDVEIKESVWSRKSASSPEELLQDVRFSANTTALKIHQEELKTSALRISGIEVEGSFRRVVVNSQGQPVYIKLRAPEGGLQKVELEIAKWSPKTDSILRALRQSDERLLDASEVGSSNLIITIQNGVPHLAIDTLYVDKGKTGIFKNRYTFETRQKSNFRVSSDFTNGQGLVYPTGVKTSSLTEKPLIGLSGDGTLTKNTLTILPQIADKAVNSALVFNFEPQDPRFDQVQAFYYADRALDFFSNKLGVTLPSQLQVLTEYGAPDKINAMFYYQNQVHLGLGDGMTYTNIARDPSIVVHESCHALIDLVGHLPMGEGEGGSINEGFADFLTAVALENPNLGEVAYVPGPFTRTVANTANLSAKSGGLYHDSLIMSGTLWDIKTSLGDSKALDIAMKVLARLGPSGNFAAVPAAVSASMETGYDEADQATVKEILHSRGWIP